MSDVSDLLALHQVPSPPRTEQAPDFRSVFYEQAGAGAGGHRPGANAISPRAAVEACLFVDGQHVIAGRRCPHSNPSDEMGQIEPTGWTVQQR